MILFRISVAFVRKKSRIRTLFRRISTLFYTRNFVFPLILQFFFFFFILEIHDRLSVFSKLSLVSFQSFLIDRDSNISYFLRFIFTMLIKKEGKNNRYFYSNSLLRDIDLILILLGIFLLSLKKKKDKIRILFLGRNSKEGDSEERKNQKDHCYTFIGK